MWYSDWYRVWRDSIKEQANQREKKRRSGIHKRDTIREKKKRSMNGVKTGFWSRWYSLAVRACFENKNKGKKKKEMRWLVKRLDHRCDVGTEYDSNTYWAGDEVWL